MSQLQPSATKVYSYQHKFPNGATYTVKRKYNPTGKPKGRPKLTPEQRIANMNKKIKELQDEQKLLIANNQTNT